MSVWWWQLPGSHYGCLGGYHGPKDEWQASLVKEFRLTSHWCHESLASEKEKDHLLWANLCEFLVLMIACLNVTVHLQCGDSRAPYTCTAFICFWKGSHGMTAWQTAMISFCLKTKDVLWILDWKSFFHEGFWLFPSEVGVGTLGSVSETGVE